MVSPGRQAQPKRDSDPRGSRRAGVRAGWQAPIALIVFAASATLLVYGLLRMRDPGYLADSGVYREGGERVLHHLPVYGSARHPGLSDLFTYPPFAALLFTPLALAPESAYRMVFPVGCLAALVAIVWIALRLTGQHPPGGPSARRPAAAEPAARGAAAPGAAAGMRLRILARALALGAFLLWIQPVRWTMFIGQINLLLLLLILTDFVPSKRQWHRGIGVGLAAGIKLTPALFVVYLLLTRQLRTAAVAVATFLVTVAAGFVVLPRDSIVFWGRAVFDTSRVGPQSYDDNQSLGGLLARALGVTNLSGTVTLLCSVTTAGVGLSVACLAHHRGHRLAGVLAVGICTLLISPISWSHHWVWLVPVLVLGWTWASRARPARRAAPALAAVVAVWFLLTPADLNHLTDRNPRVPRFLLDLGWFQAFSRDTDIWLGVATLTAIAIYSWRRPADRDRHAPPGTGQPPPSADRPTTASR